MLHPVSNAIARILITGIMDKSRYDRNFFLKADSLWFFQSLLKATVTVFPEEKGLRSGLSTIFG